MTTDSGNSLCGGRFYTWDYPFHFAIQADPQEALRMMESGSAPLNDLDHYGQTPLACASSIQVLPSSSDTYRKLTIEVLQRLITLGADLNDCTRSGRPPLYCAYLARREDFVSVLLASGADVNHICNADETVFSTTIIGGNYSLAQRFFAYGADPMVGTIATVVGHVTIRKYLSYSEKTLEEVLLPLPTDEVASLTHLSMRVLVKKDLWGASCISVPFVMGIAKKHFGYFPSV